jgi:hypothetical protein
MPTMTTPDQGLQDDYLFLQLKEILLQEDRERLQHISETLDTPELLKEKIGPILEERIEVLKEHFPNQYRQIVEEVIDFKLRTSRDEVLELIYPVMGKMIQKYVRLQIQQLRDNLERQIQKRLTTGIIGRMRYLLFGFGKKDAEQIVSRLDGPEIMEVYVIEQYSGILLGSASKKRTVDLDLIAGMLTAIKSFVEDAFKQELQELELIQYDHYTIIIQNFYKFYIATAVSGSISHQDEHQLREVISILVEEQLYRMIKHPDDSRNRKIKEILYKNLIEQRFEELPKHQTD